MVPTTLTDAINEKPFLKEVSNAYIKDGFEMWQADEVDGRQRLAPSELIPMLVKAIQELSARIKVLEGK